MDVQQWHIKSTSSCFKPSALAIIIFASIVLNIATQDLASGYDVPSSITIRPVAPGNITELNSNIPENWDSVDDGARPVVTDEGNLISDIYGDVAEGGLKDKNASDYATYVSGSADDAWKADVYSLQYPIISGNISKVTLYMRCMATTEGKMAKTALQIGDVYYCGKEMLLNSSYENYSTSYELNPATGEAWAWSDIPNACWGVALNDSTARCTRVWAVIEFVHVPGTLKVSTSMVSRRQYILFGGDTLQVDATWTRNASNRCAMVIGSGDGITVRGRGEINGNWNNVKTSSHPLIYIKGNRTLIEGIAVVGNRQTGVMLADPTNCTVRNIAIKDCYSSKSPSALGVGILLHGPGERNHITGCTIERSGLHGIQVFQADITEVSNNYINGVFGFFGISIYGHGGDVADGALINWNTIKNTRCEGINADNGENLAIDHNYIDNVLTDYGLCIYRSSWGIIEFNTIDHSYKDGIALEGSSNFIVRYNTITNCARGGYHHAAILVQSSSSHDAKNNLVEGNYINDNSFDAKSRCPIKEVQVAERLADENLFQNNMAFGERQPCISLTGPNSVNSANDVNNIDG